MVAGKTTRLLLPRQETRVNTLIVRKREVLKGSLTYHLMGSALLATARKLPVNAFQATDTDPFIATP